MISLLQELLRFDTTNPPGSETACIRHLEVVLREAGVELVLAGASPDRLNLVARLKGRGEAPPLLLQGHVDVVPTAGQAWTHPPFAGELIDGEVWGRGTIDMKGGVAMMVSALLEGARAGGYPGDVVLAVVADEEAGGGQGAGWLVANRPELFAGVRHALGEGGGFALRLGGRRFYPLMVAEKRGVPVRATFRGGGGHASIPFRDGAMAKLGDSLRLLNSRRLPLHYTGATRMMLEAFRDALSGPERADFEGLLDPERAEAVLDRLGPSGRRWDALLHNSFNPTMVQGGVKLNVIPSSVSLDLDCRVLPGVSAGELLRELSGLLGPDPELEVLRESPQMPEPALSGYFETLRDIVRESDPTGTPVPFVTTGGTDARHFARLGIQTYGFLLYNQEGIEERMHDSDERASVEALEFGRRALTEAIRRYRG